MRLLFDNILIKEIKDESVVVVAGDNKKSISKGEVKAIGPGQAYGLPKFEPTTLKEGDKVYFLTDVAYKVKIEEEEMWVVRERDCLVVL